MSEYSGQVNGILGNIPIYAANAVTSISDTNWSGDYNGGYFIEYSTNTQPFRVNGITTVNGVYAGPLSALGNMVAMSLAYDGSYKWVDAVTGNPATPTSVLETPYGPRPIFANNPRGVNSVPWMLGYFRSYWRDPTKCTFGANSAIPALTGVMPEKFTDMQGNFVYYVDLQIQRLSGNNSWDNFYFINVFNQLIGYVITCNAYAKGLLEAEQKNLEYFGFKSYNELVTQGWSAYKASIALPKAFENLGVLVETIPLNIFGTSNGVTKTMIDRGLGIIGNLSDKLFNSGIVYQQIENPNYTQQLNSILLSITNPTDLAVIQSVLKTTVPTDLFTSPLSYISIESASGLTNDSGFKDLAAVGKDLYLKAPGSNFSLGIQVSNLIKQIQEETSSSIEDLKTNDSLLTPELIASLRTYLPLAANNAPISMLNVIGTASGYYAENIELVNEGIAELYATDYGPQLINILSEITRYGASYPLTQAEATAAELYTPVPPAQVGIDSSGNAYTIPGTGGPNYWRSNQQAKMNQYLALLNTIAADPALTSIVNKINDNYMKACEYLYIENTNYLKANASITSFGDNSQIFSFVSSLPEYAVDRNNIGTDYMLFALATDSVSGNIASTILNQAKNNSFISNAGGKITGLV